MTRTKKLSLSALVVGVLASVSALGVFGLFSATTQNSGNEISTGTVALSDNDGGSALINVTGAQPGDSYTKCIKISYNGSLPSTVHSWVQGATGPLADYINIKVTHGSQVSSTFPDCTGFTSYTGADGTKYDGPVAAIRGSSYETGVPTTLPGKTTWDPGNTLVVQAVVTISAAAPDTAQGSTSGDFSLHYEARNG
ncbi:MAG: hypothetical protein JWO02_1739 [Solirubrobacterales bacterium]|nr:hypothetical protein [Solirubrobacterales bacterium]